MTPNERHDALAREFATKVVGDVVKDGGDASDVMVVLETTILAGMLANAKVFGLQPQVACGLAEQAVQAAIVRFTADRARER